MNSNETIVIKNYAERYLKAGITLIKTEFIDNNQKLYYFDKNDYMKYITEKLKRR